MRQRILGLLGMVAVISVVSLVSMQGQAPSTQGQAATAGSVPKTSWGDPDLQGIWTSEEQVPLQRPAKFAGREFFTDAEVADLDKQRSAILRRDYRAEKGTE